MVVVLMLGLMGRRVSAAGVQINGIDPNTAYWGDMIRIYGAGATPNGFVLAMLNRSDAPVYLANTTVGTIDSSLNITLEGAHAQASGDWEISFVVPLASPKTYTVFVVDNETSMSDKVSLSILTKPIPPFTIDTMTPSSGKPGTEVHLYGFGCCDEGLRVYFDGTVVAELTGAVYYGWSVSFTVPNALFGNCTVMVVDVLSGGNLSRQFTVQVLPTLHLSPSEGAVGSRLTIYGEDFPAEKPLYITFEDSLLVAAYVNDGGAFNVTVFVPMVYSGDYAVKANYPVNASGQWLTVTSTQFSVTGGVDTHNQRLAELNSALVQAQTNIQSVPAMQETVGEARLYALVAMILSAIAAVAAVILIATLFITRQRQHRINTPVSGGSQKPDSSAQTR
jgi:hypothetical protein